MTKEIKIEDEFKKQYQLRGKNDKDFFKTFAKENGMSEDELFRLIARERGQTEDEFENDLLVQWALNRMQENNGTIRVKIEDL
ncbi:MAG: hypothetical protein R3F25_13340 [Gammaproteobacteria bacterium]|jgi:hypothetical protein